MGARDEASVRAFLERDWRAAERAKEEAWLALKREHGPAASVRLGEELRRQALLARPGWPTERDRADDLRTHLRLIEVIRRVPPRAR